MHIRCADGNVKAVLRMIFINFPGDWRGFPVSGFCLAAMAASNVFCIQLFKDGGMNKRDVRLPGNDQRHYKPFGTLFLSSVLLFSFGTGLPYADETLVAAEWRNGQHKLLVKGIAAQGSSVVVRNAYADQQWSAMATDRNAWSIQIARPNPVPCALTIDNEKTVIFVQNTPNYCGPKPPRASDPETGTTLAGGMY